MTYYLYVSDAKVDMLFAKIPQNFLSGIALELSINLGELGKVTATQRPKEETRFTKLAAVVKYLRKTADVGTVDDPNDYFWGSMPMKWKLLDTEKTDMVIFAGTVDQTLVVLNGSGHHVLGAGPQLPSRTLGSVAASGVEFVKSLPHVLADAQRPAQVREDGDVDTDESLRALEEGISYLSAPTQQLEFLAKRHFQKGVAGIWRGSENGPAGQYPDGVPTRFLFGSPIYVAQAD
jgi:hypothetical protein